MNEIEQFVTLKGARHPELRRRVQWSGVRAIAAREGVHIRVMEMSRPGRLVSFGDRWEMQISEDLSDGARAFTGVHELVHYWRDREDGATFYASMEWEPEPREDFANMVAWYLTSSAHEFYSTRLSTQDE